MNKSFRYSISSVVALSLTLTASSVFAYAGTGRVLPPQYKGKPLRTYQVTQQVIQACSGLKTEQEKSQCTYKLLHPETTTSATVQTTGNTIPTLPAGSTTTTNAQTVNSQNQGQFFRMPFVTITTSPYVGELTAFDASDVLNQAAKINEDLLLLQTRQQMAHDMKAAGLDLTRPIIEFSGGLEGQLVESDGYNGSSGDIDLSSAELDMHAIVSEWASGFMAFTYDDSNSNVTGTRLPNSRIFLSRGFVNIGNLDVTPIYFTIGQMYLPFGRYSSDMITSPVTMSLARTDDRDVVLGYYHQGFNASLYSYDGSSTTNGNFVFKQGGVNLGYKRAFAQSNNFSIGTGLESNMTDSNGLQNTGRGSDDQFSGFDQPTGSNAITHRVPAADIHSEIYFGKWNAKGEFISAVRDASANDLTFNNEGALPEALHTELEREFGLAGYDMHALLAYDHTWQALAANLPEQSIIANLHTSFWKNTVEAIEYRHDIDYSSDDTATGSQANVPSDVPIFGTGKSRNIVVLQVGAYF